MSDEARIEEMIAAACLRSGSEASFTADLRAFLGSHGIDEADIEAIVAAPPRLALYRRLIRNNLTGVTEKMLGRTRARMNAAAEGSFDAAFAEFLDEVGPRSHYLRDVPGEFLAWAEPRWRGRADLPAWAADLARHELVEFQVGAAPAPAEPPRLTDPSPDRPLVFAGPIRLMRYAFAVHALASDLSDRTEPAPSPTALLVYRDDDHAVQFLELTPLAAAITERLLGGATLAAAIRAATEELGASASVNDVAALLADFGERGILLGAPA